MTDDIDARYVFTAILNYDGYRIVVARNGAEGVKCALEDHPALIMMDISMPVMDGLTAAALIREDLATARTPMIMLSGNHLSGEEQDRANRLFDACFSKPMEPRRMLEEITRMIGPAHS